jgi:hypothetical protein
MTSNYEKLWYIHMVQVHTPPPYLNLEVERLYHPDSTLDTANFLHSIPLGMLTEGITFSHLLQQKLQQFSTCVPSHLQVRLIQKSRTVVICKEWGNMSEERNTWLHNHCLTSWEKFYTATVSHSISEWPSINEASSLTSLHSSSWQVPQCVRNTPEREESYLF